MKLSKETKEKINKINEFMKENSFLLYGFVSAMLFLASYIELKISWSSGIFYGCSSIMFMLFSKGIYFDKKLNKIEEKLNEIKRYKK